MGTFVEVFVLSTRSCQWELDSLCVFRRIFLLTLFRYFVVINQLDLWIIKKDNHFNFFKNYINLHNDKLNIILNDR